MQSPTITPLSDLTYAPTEAIPAMASIGVIRLHAGERSPCVPIALPIGGEAEGSAGLCVRTKGSAAEVAALQQAVAIRLACAIEPHLLRIHAVDLVEVGAHFSYLGSMPEGVFTKRDLVTDGRALTTLLHEILDEAKSRHLDKLGHRYATLREYQAATASGDPLRVLIISAFPAAWAEEQLTVLRQILTLAAKVGIWCIIHHDPSIRTGGIHELSGVAAEVVSPLTRLSAEGKARRFVLAQSPVVAMFHPDWVLLPDGLSAALPTAHLGELFTQMRQSAEEVTSRDAGLQVPIATRSGQPFHIMLGHGGALHALIGGATGSGKSVLLHNIVLGLIEHYTPAEVRLVLMDLKEGTEFSPYEHHPMTLTFLHSTDSGQAIEALQQVQAAFTERGQLFRSAGVNNLPLYNQAHPDRPLPRIVIVVDEFQRLFIGDYKVRNSVNALLEDLAKRGRSFGIHLIMGSQSLAQTPLEKSTQDQFGLRIVLKMAESECTHFLGFKNDAPSRFTRAGQAIYNAHHGLLEKNMEIKVSNLSLEEVKTRVAASMN